MKIIVQSEKHKKIKLYFPTSIIKRKWIYRIAKKNVKDKDIDFNKIYKFSKDLYRELKKYVKENGHFNLVDIESGDEKIVIRI